MPNILQMITDAAATYTGSSLDQYGEQSGRRQQTRTWLGNTTGNRFRSRIKRLARTARQRNRGLDKRVRNMFRQTYRLSQKRYLRQCRHNFGRKLERAGLAPKRGFGY